ncbi:MAG: hypothetical protein PF448_08010 [Bacteroidales bacterium]|jgi:hypothetical protein|nr:hypothetical protein [Bacteroidales bacterium]
MKKIILFLVSFFFANFMMAQSVIVLHSTDTTAVFTGNTAFQDAYALAESSDTLYLSGGAFTITSSIEKGLKIFGAGIHPDSTSATYITQLSGIVNIIDGADGLYFEGIQFSHEIREHFVQVVDDVSFVRCKFISLIDFGISGPPAVLRKNYAFIQSVFLDRLDMEGVTNSLITNCIFNDRIYNTNSNSIKNTSFLYNPSNASYDLMTSSDNNLISNCIFHTLNSYLINGASNTVQNCVTQDAAPDFGSTPIDVNNYKGIDLSTVLIALPSEPFSFDDNYHLTPSAETTYLGDEGTQVGVYGGLFPLKEGFVPQNPHISTKTISSGTDENGFLNVDVEVNAQDN